LIIVKKYYELFLRKIFGEMKLIRLQINLLRSSKLKISLHNNSTTPIIIKNTGNGIFRKTKSVPRR